MTNYEEIIKQIEVERQTFVLQRDKAIEEIAKRDAAIGSLRRLMGPEIVTSEMLLGDTHPPVGKAERLASWLPQPIDSYQKAKFSGSKTAAVEPPSMPDHGPRPVEAGPNWLSILASQASPFALALAFLRTAGSPFTTGHLSVVLTKIRGIKNAVAWTVMPSLLKADVVEGAGQNNVWRIKHRERGGILSDDLKYLWCDPTLLNIYDWAAIRREAMLVLLKEHTGGLTNAAITKTLQNTEWLHAPVDPHLIKADLRQLEGKRVVEQDASKLWKLVEGV